MRAAGLLALAWACAGPDGRGAAKPVAAAPGGGAGGEGGGGLVDVEETLQEDDRGPTQEVITRTTAQGEISAAAPGEGAVRLGVEREVPGGPVEPLCAAEVALGAAPLAGDCAGCDFAFALAPALTRDEGGCWWAPAFSLTPPVGPYVVEPVLGWWSSYTTPVYTYESPYGEVYTWGGTSYSDLLRLGWTYVWPAYDGPYGSTPETRWGPVWRTLNAAGPYSAYGDWAVEVDAAGLRWSAVHELASIEATPRDEPCAGPLPVVEAVTGWIGEGAVSGVLPCVDDGVGLRGAGAMDRWAFSAAAGTRLVITVDTVDLDTAFDPLIWVDGPAGCALAYGDDELECSAPPPEFGCPAIRFEAPEDGVYEVVVTAQASCAGAEGAYRLDVVAEP